jgi:hypothetical protein
MYFYGYISFGNFTNLFIIHYSFYIVHFVAVGDKCSTWNIYSTKNKLNKEVLKKCL